MLLRNIIKEINRIIGNNSSIPLTYKSLEFYINSSVDYINQFLNTTMLSPEEDWNEHQYVYNIIYNDKYLGASEQTPTASQVGQIYYDLNDSTYYVWDGTLWSELGFTEDQELPLNIYNTANYDYSCMPDDIIRSVLIYYTAALYLEEEDEFEAQHKSYKSRAENALLYIRKNNYSVYELERPKHHKKDDEEKDYNPYWVGDDWHV